MHALFKHEEPLEDASQLFNEKSSYDLIRRQEYSMTDYMKELSFTIRKAIPKLTIAYTIIVAATCLVAFIIAKCQLKAGWLASLAMISSWIKILND